jgi:NAD(P)-dependent dehydrogenase (short-subunit alcohol dehydrogenase family)
MRLSQKTALVTGAARGIGQAIARLFHREGATVILTDIRDEEGLAVAKAFGERAAYLHLDVSREADWIESMQYICTHYGNPDILVNNAGITGFLESQGPFDAEHVDLDSWDLVHRVNCTGVMLGCKWGIRHMKESGGSIVNISSRSGLVGIPGAVAYASSKASVRNHTKSVAL